MARTDRGLDLRIPVLKPNSSRFTQTEAGFDVGSRTFSVDEEHLPDWIPERDKADTALEWQDHRGLRQGLYGTMYVSSVDIGATVNGVVEFTVSFLGLIKRDKKDYATVQSATTTFNGAAGIVTRSFYSSAPVVTIVKVMKQKPEASELGTEMIPPGWNQYAFNPRINGVLFPTIYLAKWILRERDYRQAGELYEVRNQHVFDVVM